MARNLFNLPILNKYIEKLIETKKDWASADWIGKKWSLGIDIAICRNSYIDKNPDSYKYAKRNNKGPTATKCGYFIGNALSKGQCLFVVVIYFIG